MISWAEHNWWSASARCSLILAKLTLGSHGLWFSVLVNESGICMKMLINMERCVWARFLHWMTDVWRRVSKAVPGAWKIWGTARTMYLSSFSTRTQICLTLDVQTAKPSYFSIVIKEISFVCKLQEKYDFSMNWFVE